jgi:hypothetical protein
LTKTKTDKKIYDEIEQIRQLRIMGASDQAIVQALNLSYSAFWRRVKLMYKQDKQLMHELFSDAVPTQVKMLEARLLSTIDNCTKMATNEGIDPFARIEADRLKIDCSVSLVRMYREGPLILSEQIDGLEDREQELRYSVRDKDGNIVDTTEQRSPQEEQE